MSGGSQHNPNGRQSQLGPGWSPLQVANLLARAPQVHMPAERGVTWHTPTPPPHLYHVPAPSPPDPLQGMKGASSNSVFRHTATPPELYRHTPTPPDKHLLRHTPSPGDVKAGAALPQPELYPHLGPGRDKLVRPEELLASYTRVGVDLSLGGRGAANGSPAPAHPPSPALSVRDAPTINSLIARAQPHGHGHGHGRLGHARVDALLERLVPSPVSPHSVIVHSRAAPTPSPPSSNEDSADSCGAPPGSKRKRKPERTLRVAGGPPPAPPPPASPARSPAPSVRAEPDAPANSRATPPARATPPVNSRATPPVPAGITIEPVPAVRSATPPVSAPAAAPGAVSDVQSATTTKPPTPATTPSPAPAIPPSPPKPLENGDTPHSKSNGPEKPPTPPHPTSRRKIRSGSAETIDDIAAMIASTDRPPGEDLPPDPPKTPLQIEPVTVDNLKSVLASPEPVKTEAERQTPPKTEDKLPEANEAPQVEAAAAPRRRSARTSNSESANVPVESPSEAKPAEPETSEPTVEPTAASFVEVENQLEKMFAGIEEPANNETEKQEDRQTAKAKKRRKSAPTKGERKASRRASRASTTDEPRRKAARKDVSKGKKSKESVKDAYDSGSNASSSRSRGPYIQIRGPRDSPLSVSVINAVTGEEEGEGAGGGARRGEGYRALRARGLHASTLGARYDAATPDATWLCVFCDTGPHHAGLGDLFGPYTIRPEDADPTSGNVDEASRHRYSPGGEEVWFHAACGVWAPGLVACGARVWGLAAAVWGARAARCGPCARPGPSLACAHRPCRARAHLPCARAARWTLDEDRFRALCPKHA